MDNTNSTPNSNPNSNSETNIINTYNIVQNESPELCLIDPVILLGIIGLICVLLYIINFKLSSDDKK